jgi:hypothetical protein
MNIGVALPEWVFASDRRTAPLVLLALVFAGLAVPILAIAVYLHRAEGKVGANRVLEETLVMYHRFTVREMLRVTKMYESIVPAKEFMNIQLTDAQARPSACRVPAHQHRNVSSCHRAPERWAVERSILETKWVLLCRRAPSRRFRRPSCARTTSRACPNGGMRRCCARTFS